MTRILLLALLAGCSYEHQGLPGGPPEGGTSDVPPAGSDATPDGCVPAAETCNGLDDDCDGTVDEGFPLLGTPCDAADSDLCHDDVYACAGPMTVLCGGPSPDEDVERCNDADDDCDGAIDEDFPGVGGACDGPDADLCPEGQTRCTDDGAGTECTDATGDTLELCNGLDDDCDGGADEANCGACGVACTNGYGTNTCTASQCVPTCMGAGAGDCDGNPNNGCEPRDTNPPCAGGGNLGSVRGDAGADTLVASGFGEAWYVVQITEENGTSYDDLTARFTLNSPPNVNYDLHVRCGACSDPVSLSSTNGAGQSDVVTIGRVDVSGWSSYDVIVEIRYVGATACGTWNLLVEGNVSTVNLLCTD